MFAVFWVVVSIYWLLVLVCRFTLLSLLFGLLKLGLIACDLLVGIMVWVFSVYLVDIIRIGFDIMMEFGLLVSCWCDYGFALILDCLVVRVYVVYLGIMLIGRFLY